MPKYRYEAFNTRGHSVSGAVWAPTEAEARIQLQVRRYEVKTLREDISGTAWVERQLARMRPASLLELAVCTRQLAVMLHAGLAVDRALQILIQQPLGRALADALTQVERDVSNGMWLSKALSRYPLLFGGLYTGLVKAGEAAGTLSGNLSRLADHLEREVELRRKVGAALIYPVFVFVCCLGLSVLIVQHILPSFLNGIFKEAGQDLPWMTRSLIAVTAFFNDPRAMGTLIGTLAVGSWLLRNHLRTAAGRLQLQEFLLSVPQLRGLYSKLLTSRFCRSMATLLVSGINVTAALELTGQAVDNRVLEEYLKVAVADLKEGQPLHRAVRAIPIFPPLLAHYIELGEETGQGPDLMDRLAHMCDLELELALVAFTQLIEPVMVAVMGGMVAYVMVAIFVPLYHILGNF